MLLSHLPLDTPRLHLRRLTDEDTAHVAAMLADPVVMRHFPRPLSRSESEAWLRRTFDRYRRDGTGLFAVCLDGAWIGDCGLVLRRLQGRPALELGYHFTRAAWGHGYATEAARACLDLATRAAPALPVVAFIRPGNIRSRRVVGRLGFRVGGTLLHAGLVHECWRVPVPSPAT